jgi:2,4-dienoyl-CoA reductase-like NADH-dependent reductase (Old Yellow Enzyme family)/NADPH-dependent 2,4-dienoyl-CoA reductase/sulfur reductase-like enzyme
MTELKELLKPGMIKNVQIKNRVSLAPMERGYANMDGSISQRYIDYLVERAKNGVGMMNVESTYIDAKQRGRLYQVGLYDDSLIPSHRRLTDAVHRYGAKIVAEIQHPGRQAGAMVNGVQPIGPSAVPCMATGGDIPRVLAVQEINELAGMFAKAAVRARKAGYDMISIHGGHGYIINAFASPFSNLRTDEYGGSQENRFRFALEVYTAVRAAVGDDFAVGYRMSADEFIDGGLTLDDTRVLAKRLEAAGIDFLDISAGVYESVDIIAPPIGMPLGCLVFLAAEIKEIVEVPIIATGRINDMVFAESILKNNQADFVHMVRAFNADPEILVKSQRGQMDDVCMCMGCMKCSDTMAMNLPSICTVNPAAGREREFALVSAKTKKKVMVIGGGVAGMEAARIAAQRGHDVTLYEKDDELGGQIRWASKGKFHEEFFQTARYRIHEVRKSRVKIIMGKEVTLADVKAYAPDVVIVATGAEPFQPAIPGINNPMVSTGFDILSGKAKAGKTAVVIGGKRQGLTVAEFLAEKGSKVIIVEPSLALGSDMGFVRMMVTTRRISEDPAITVRLKTSIEKIDHGEVVLQSEGIYETLTGIDSVVAAWQTAPVNMLAEEIALDGKVSEVYSIGDAVLPRDASDAIYEGAIIGRKI